jgi:hypothetical protein
VTPTLKSRAITYARRYPGQSATQIAHALKAKPCSVSGILHRACAAGDLVRTEAKSDLCHWNVRGGGGPAGGHRYGPIGWTP